MQYITTLFFYDSNSGIAEFYSMDAHGNLSQLSSTTYSKGWTHIVPVNFQGPSNTELLFYNSNSGLAQFYRTDGAGGIHELSSSTYYKGWTHIVPGYFVQNSAYSALLFYNSNSGFAQFYSTDGQGGLHELSSSTYSKGWTHIVPGSFGLLFYNSNSGLGQFYSVNLTQSGGLHELSSSTYSKGWTHIVDTPVQQGYGDIVDDNLLFYNSTSGLAQFYRTDQQGSIHELSSTTYPTGWTLIEWLENAVSKIAYSALTSFGLSNGQPRVYYIGQDEHVYELAWGGSAWGYGDLINASGNAPVTIVGSALTSFGLNGTSPRVYYIGTNNHVYELAWLGSSWSHRDVTNASGNAPATMTGSALTSFGLSNGQPRVYYIGTNNHVYELAWLGSSWSYRDVTNASGNAPVVAQE